MDRSIKTVQQLEHIFQPYTRCSRSWRRREATPIMMFPLKHSILWGRWGQSIICCFCLLQGFLKPNLQKDQCTWKPYNWLKWRTHYDTQSRGSTVSTVARICTGWSRVQIPMRAETFLFSKMSRPAMEPTQPLTRYVTGFFPVYKAAATWSSALTLIQCCG